MREPSVKVAVCSVTAALCVVVMLLGSFLGLGLYVSPILAGLLLVPVGERWGAWWQLAMWAAVGLLCLMLVPDVEEVLLFLGFFGWYPALRPRLQRLPPVLRTACKFLVFNVSVVAVEALVILVLVPETAGAGLLALFLVLGNVIFYLYDAATISAFALLAGRFFKKFFPKGGDRR